MKIIATRRERVIIEAVDDFSTPVAKMAAAAALLDKNLGGLSRNAVTSQRSLASLGRNDGLPTLTRNASSADRSINQLSGRLVLFARAAAMLGPALAPIGASAVPALSGMATQLGLTVAAAGTAVLAFQGIGEGLEALNAYQLEPTAENFQKMQLALEKVGPAGADFVRFLDSVAPKFEQLQMTAREGLFPGVQDGITSLLSLLPQMDRIVGDVAGAMGQLASEAGAGLSGEGFTAFFDFLETSAKPILVEMGRTIGNFAEGFANLLVGFGPLSADFSGGLLDMSRAFSEWSQNLDNNAGFQEFLSYVQESAPKVLDLLGSFVNVFVQVAQAMAPVGDVVVPALTQLLDVVAAIADSPLGTMFIAGAAGLSAYTLAANTAAAASARLGIAGSTGLGRFNAMVGGLKVGAVGLGALGLAMSDLDDKAGLSNTAMLGLVGTLAGPWGAAVGAAAGFTMDLSSATDDLTTAMDRANRAADTGSFDQQKDALVALRQEIDRVNEAGQAGNFFTLDVGRNIDFFKAKYAEMSGAIQEAENAQADLANQMRGGAGIASLMIGPLGLTSDAAEAAAQSMEEFSEAVAAAMGILDRRESLRNFRDSIREFNDTLKDAPKNLRPGTAAFDEVEGALDSIGRNALTAAEHLKGMDRVNFLSRARKDFVSAARDMGFPIERAQELADRLGLLNKTTARPKVDAETKAAQDAFAKVDRAMVNLNGKTATPEVRAEASAALSAIQSVGAALAGLDGRSATVTTTYRTVYTTSGGKQIPEQRADGGTVGGQRQPYGDKVLSWLAPGEEVISNRYGQADQFRADRAAGRIPHYADGGTVQRLADGGPVRFDRGAAGAGNDLRDAGNGAKSLAQRLREATRELERETRQRSELRNKMQALRSDVRGSFDNDLFGNGLAGLQLQLEADRNDSRSMRAALNKARKRGLNGGLFAELAASGDLNTAQQLSSLSRGEIGQLERLFAQTNQAQSDLAEFATNKQFGQAVREQTKEVKHLRQAVDRLEERIERGVERGARNGIEGRDRKASQRARAGR